jgi:hypothetical protein
MKASMRLSAEEIAAAIRYWLEKEKGIVAGMVTFSYSPPDRPCDSGEYYVSVDAEVPDGKAKKR